MSSKSTPSVEAKLTVQQVEDTRNAIEWSLDLQATQLYSDYFQQVAYGCRYCEQIARNYNDIEHTVECPLPRWRALLAALGGRR